MDNLLEESKPRRTSRERSQTIDVLDLSGIDNCNALPRKLAWADTTNIFKDSNKLTEEWMEEWQVMFRCLRSLNYTLSVYVHGRSLRRRRTKAYRNNLFAVSWVARLIHVRAQLIFVPRLACPSYSRLGLGTRNKWLAGTWFDWIKSNRFQSGPEPFQTPYNEPVWNWKRLIWLDSLC